MKVKTKNTIISNSDYTHLKPDKMYEVIGVSCDYFRIINEKGEPILYPNVIFDVIDKTIPNDWDRDYGEEADEYYFDPIEFSKPGFYEDLFEDKEYAIKAFYNYVIKHGYMTKELWEEKHKNNWCKVTCEEEK